jgi:histidine triad (HIT) family protein
MNLTGMTDEDRQKQLRYRDARFTKQYDGIWQSVGKCVFCDMKDKYVFYEENGIVMTIQLFAYIDGHFMIVPRRHVQSMKELTPLEWETIRKCSYIAKKIIKEVHGIKGMQFLQKDGADAQSTVGHIHFHCIPFDEPDLSIWNYRKLTNTPLENAQLYKEQESKIKKLAIKFDQKYKGGAA